MLTPIDAHLHLWDESLLAPPWLVAVPHLSGRFDRERYRAEGGTGGPIVLVEADVAAGDRAREAGLLDRWGREAPRHAVVAAIAPGEATFADELEVVRRYPMIRGGRRVLHGGPFRATDAFIADLSRLAADDLSFDFCVRCADLPEVGRCLRGVPKLRAIVDHLGNPPIRAGWNSPEADAWRRDVRGVAECENAVVKLSAMFENAGGAIDADAARPWFGWCLEAFGSDRMMWGSNWPVCFQKAPLTAWREVTESLLADLQPGERDSILGATAARIYRLG
jgi:L-fuconolactonase